MIEWKCSRDCSLDNNRIEWEIFIARYRQQLCPKAADNGKSHNFGGISSRGATIDLCFAWPINRSCNDSFQKGNSVAHLRDGGDFLRFSLSSKHPTHFLNTKCSMLPKCFLNIMETYKSAIMQISQEIDILSERAIVHFSCDSLILLKVIFWIKLWPAFHE